MTFGEIAKEMREHLETIAPDRGKEKAPRQIFSTVSATPKSNKCDFCNIWGCEAGNDSKQCVVFSDSDLDKMPFHYGTKARIMNARIHVQNGGKKYVPSYP